MAADTYVKTDASTSRVRPVRRPSKHGVRRVRLVERCSLITIGGSSPSRPCGKYRSRLRHVTKVSTSMRWKRRNDSDACDCYFRPISGTPPPHQRGQARGPAIRPARRVTRAFLPVVCSIEVPVTLRHFVFRRRGHFWHNASSQMPTPLRGGFKPPHAAGVATRPW
jgi:hypothetical protein